MPAPFNSVPSASVAGASAPAGQDWLAGASPRVRAMCAELRASLLSLPGVSERIGPLYGQRSCDYLLDGKPFVHAVPLGARLRLLLNLRHGELKDPEGIAVCTSRSRWGRSRWQIDVADGRDLERAVPLVRQAFDAADQRC